MRFRIELIAASAAVMLAACTATFGDIGSAGVPADGPGGADAGPPVDASGADAAPCPETATTRQDPATGHCFELFPGPLTWNQAQEACAALGPTVHLAVSTSPEENEVFAPLAGVADAWIGGTDFLSEDDWIWLNFEPMIYEGWRAGEPNNGGVGGEDCMIVEGELGGTWDDRGCNVVLPFICERE